MDGSIALIIAADPGVAFSRSKYLLHYREGRLLQSVVDDARSWPVDDLVVVLGPDAEAVAAEIDVGEGLVIMDPEWEEGIAASLRVGLDTVAREGHQGPVVVAMGDQPGVDHVVVSGLLERSALRPTAAVVPKYRYVRGWPIVLGAALWGRYLGLEGEVDLLAHVTSHADGVEEVVFDTLAPGRILEPSDLQ